VGRKTLTQSISTVLVVLQYIVISVHIFIKNSLASMEWRWSS